METQQGQQSHQPQKSKSHLKRRLIIAVVIVALLVSTVWILSSLAIIQGIWATIVSTFVTVFGVVFTFLPLIISADKPEPPPTPQINVQVQLSPFAPQPPIPTFPTASSYRGIIGLPPPTDPRTIQQREQVVKEVYHQLNQPDITAIALTGIGGIGKSTLAALIYRHAEDHSHTGNSPFTARPLWLTINPAVTMSDLANTLIEALGKPMLNLATLSPQNQAAALFNALNTVDKSRLIILDQFENLLDLQTGKALPDRVGVSEWLDALNNQPCRCRILLTSRLDPQGTHPPTFLQTYHVEGLEESEGIELLRKQGVTGSETDLLIAVTRCNGHAFALTLLASLLRTHKLSLATLLNDPAFTQFWSDMVAQNLLDSVYKQLDQLQRKLLVAFSVYREPIPLEAAQSIIDNTQTSESQLKSALDALLVQHLIQAAGEGYYQLHAIVANYAQGHFVEDNEQANQQALRAAHNKAAHYYRQQALTSCPPRELRRHISDVHDLIEAIWQYCQAEQRQKAYDLIQQEGIEVDLNLWGGNAILLELYQLLLSGKWHLKRNQTGSIYNNLGKVYDELGKKEEALTYYEQALNIRRGIRDRKGEGVTLNNLGNLYSTLEEKEKALEYYEQALGIRREVGDHEGEGKTLNNLGILNSILGKQEKALEYYEQALNIVKEFGIYQVESTMLNNLGGIYNELGKKEQALTYYERALRVQQEIGDCGGESTTLNNLGGIYYALGKKDEALAYYIHALSIQREIGYRNQESVTLSNLAAVYNDLGKKAEALTYLERALSIQREVGNRGGEGVTLSNLATVYSNLDKKDDALQYYEKALSIHREISDRSGEGVTLHNIGVINFERGRYDVALACFLLARGIFKEIQSPSNYEDEQKRIVNLQERVGEERFSVLLAQVEPQVYEIIEHSLAEDS